MAESLLSQTVIAYSTAPESTYGVNPVTASLFTPMVTRARAFPVPQTEKTDDRGVIGRKTAMYPTFQRSGFAQPIGFEFTDMAQATTLAPLLRRYMGKAGTTPTTVEAAIAFKHTFKEADPDVDGLQLPSSSCVYSLNEYDYLLTGGVGSTLQFTQQGAADPSYTMAIVTSGNRKRISVDYPSFGAMALPPQDAYMYGPQSQMTYTDDLAATQNLTTPSHKLRSQTFSANNNLNTGDTRAGMPPIDATTPQRGWYRDFLYFGDREVSAEWTMGMDSTYNIKDAEEKNLVYTNWKWTMLGDYVGASVTNKYSVAVVIPKFNLRTPSAGESNNLSTKTFTIFPLVHAAYYGVYSIEVINGVSIAIT